MKKYRLVKQTSNVDDKVTYIIEKRKRFLWRSWWSQSYLDSYMGSNAAATFTNYAEALRYLKMYNGEIPWAETQVIA